MKTAQNMSKSYRKNGKNRSNREQNLCNATLKVSITKQMKYGITWERHKLLPENGKFFFNFIFAELELVFKRLEFSNQTMSCNAEVKISEKLFRGF